MTIIKYADSLVHSHLYDARGNNNHLRFGEGYVDLMHYLDLIRKHGCRIVLEVKTIDGLRRSVEWLKERGLS